MVGHGSWGGWEWCGLLWQVSDSRILCYNLHLKGHPSNLSFTSPMTLFDGSTSGFYWLRS